MINLQEFQGAQERIKVYLDKPPLRYSKWLSDTLQAEVYLKLECLNPGRSFKIRGALNALLSNEQLPELVITASGGNHGLGVAIACQLLSVACKVVLPTSTSSHRVELLHSFGARVELKGDAWDESNLYAKSLANNPGCLYIPSFADVSVMTGQGTIVLEIAEDLPEFEVFAASIGGGGLLGGNLLALEALGLNDVTTVGIETQGADSMIQSLEAGKLVTLDAITSIAKTLGAKQTTAELFDIHQKYLDRYFTVSDEATTVALFEFLTHEKLLVEPASSCIIAAALQNPEVFENTRSVFVICGGNVTLSEALSWQAKFGIQLPP